jgi:hypothetical protein
LDDPFHKGQPKNNPAVFKTQQSMKESRNPKRYRSKERFSFEHKINAKQDERHGQVLRLEKITI